MKIISRYAIVLLALAAIIFQAHAIDPLHVAGLTKTFVFEGPDGQGKEVKIPQSVLDNMNALKGLVELERFQPKKSSDNDEIIEIPYSFSETIIENNEGMTFESFMSYLGNIIALLQSTPEHPFNQPVESFMELEAVADALGCDPFPKYMIQSLDRYFLLDPVSSTILQVHTSTILPEEIKISPFGSIARLWDFRDKSNPTSIVLRGHSDQIDSVALSPDGNYALTGSRDYTARLWDLRDKSNITSIELLGHADMILITSIAFSPDGQYALTASWQDHTARLWDLRDKTNITAIELRDHTGEISSAVFSPDGNYALTGSDDKTARLWDLHDKSNITSIALRGHTGEIRSVVFSPDGNYALTGSTDGTARLWDLRDKTNITSIVLRGHTYVIKSVAFSPDGKYALTGSTDGTARLWDLRDKTNITSIVLRGDMPGITSVAFSPDGNYALTGSYGHIVRLWDLRDKANINSTELRGHVGDVTAVAFSPDGNYALTESYVKIVRLWNLNPLHDVSQVGIALLFDFMKAPDKQLFIAENSDLIAGSLREDDSRNDDGLPAHIQERMNQIAGDVQ